jgi:hypothetical protein
MAWTLVYENDASGRHIAGNLSTLIKAVEAGAEVRVLTSDGMHVIRTAQFVYVLDGKVYAQNNTNISIDIKPPAGGTQIMFQPDSYHYFEMLNTEGYRDQIRWSVGEHTPRGHTQDRVACKWFVG